MKKLERLLYIARTYGEDAVLPYQACRTEEDIRSAVGWMESMGRTWGMRSDFRNGSVQGFHLPFLHRGNLPDALKIRETYPSLVYIVSENILRYRLNAVAVKVGPSHIFVEWNEDAFIPQRRMYDRPEDLKRIAVGPAGHAEAFGSFVRAISPEHLSWYRFDIIWDTMIHSDVDETTFSVRDDGKLVVW